MFYISAFNCIFGHCGQKICNFNLLLSPVPRQKLVNQSDFSEKSKVNTFPFNVVEPGAKILEMAHFTTIFRLLEINNYFEVKNVKVCTNTFKNIKMSLILANYGLGKSHKFSKIANPNPQHPKSISALLHL